MLGGLKLQVQMATIADNYWSSIVSACTFCDLRHVRPGVFQQLYILHDLFCSVIEEIYPEQPALVKIKGSEFHS